jgi:hypothetical protein
MIIGGDGIKPIRIIGDGKTTIFQENPIGFTKIIDTFKICQIITYRFFLMNDIIS